jgi:hypothetical protein
VARESNRDKVVALFKPDAEGISDWVPVDRFVPAGLRWSTNGNMRYGKPQGWGASDIKWEEKRAASSPRSTITHLRMIGWDDSHTSQQNQSISAAVKRALENNNLDNFSLMPIPDGQREIDHRYGNKDHKDYVALYQLENQRPEYFQVTIKALNAVKRQMCNTCRATGVRPPHPELGYAEGDATHADKFPCKGCHLAEPERFRRSQISPIVTDEESQHGSTGHSDVE